METNSGLLNNKECSLRFMGASLIQMRGEASLEGSRNPGSTTEWAEDTAGH